MANINLGFHALPSEICEMVVQTVQQNDLIAITAKIWPEFEFTILPHQIKENDLSNIINARFVFLCTDTPEELSQNYNEFLDQNSENLVVQIREISENSIRESSIGTRCQDVSKLKLWKKIIKSWKTKMYHGLWGVNPNTGAKQYYRNCYYTEGVKIASMDGLILKAFAGDVEFHI